jgi:hypothetical protein
MPDRRQNNDHDLLVELRTEMKAVRADIKDLKDGTQARLSSLESDRVTQEEHKDHENRLRKVENKITYWAGGLVVLEAVLGYIIYQVLK